MDYLKCRARRVDPELRCKMCAYVEKQQDVDIEAICVEMRKLSRLYALADVVEPA